MSICSLLRLFQVNPTNPVSQGSAEMVLNADDQRLMVKVARKYYEEEMTQAAIAEFYGVSRQKVQRLLDQGKKDGIVRISIRPPLHLHEKLESDLESLYGLREAVVVDTELCGIPGMVRTSIGIGAAEYLLKILKDNLKITISWGETLLCMAKALVRCSVAKKTKNITVIQGLGFVSEPSIDSHSCEIVNLIAGVLDAKKYLLSAPGIAATHEAREVFLSDPNVSEVLQIARCADVAFLGIGTLTPDTMIIKKNDSISWSEMKALKDRGAVGDIALRYYDKDGRLVPSVVDKRVVGLALDELRNIKTVVGVAGGLEKVEAIRGALTGKLIDVLVTDCFTARELLLLQSGETVCHD